MIFGHQIIVSCLNLSLSPKVKCPPCNFPPNLLCIISHLIIAFFSLINFVHDTLLGIPDSTVNKPFKIITFYSRNHPMYTHSQQAGQVL